MHLVFCVFAIGVVNLCLGYAMGVRFGRNPPRLRNAWQALGSFRSNAGIRPEVEATKRMMEELEQQVASLEQVTRPGKPEEAPDEVAEPELPPLEALQRMVARTTPRLTDLAKRLRRTAGAQQGRTAWSFVGELQEICEPYLQGLGDVVEHVIERPNASGEDATIGQQLEQTVLEQLAQLETTVNNLRHMDFSAGFSEAKNRIAGETDKLLALAGRLEEALLVPRPDAGHDGDLETDPDVTLGAERV